MSRILALSWLFSSLIGAVLVDVQTARGQDVDWAVAREAPAPPKSNPWAPLVPALIDAAINSSRNPYQPPHRGWDNGYYPPRAPQYVTPAPAPVYYAPAPPPAPKNTVVTRKKPKSNTMNLRNITGRASAETDARQALEAEKAKDMLDDQIIAAVNNLGDKALTEKWNEIVRNGKKTADVDKFLGELEQRVQEMEQTADKSKINWDRDIKAFGNVIETGKVRQKFAEASDALQTGRLSDPQKTAILNDLKDTVTTTSVGKNSTFYNTLDGYVDNMQNFNTLGMIADATQGSGNPFAPLVQGATQIGMPMQFVSEMTGFPVMAVDPLGNFTGTGTASILIYNPSDNDQSVSYLLGSYKFEMAAGSEQRLDRRYEISFDPGVAGGQKRYKLTDGVYEWRNDPAKGWNLYKGKVAVTIDNSRYDGEFRYLLNNESKTVGPGEIVEHSGDRPIEIAFDSGKGKESRKLLKSGAYVVGIDPDRGELDLFDAAKVEIAEAAEPDYLPSTLVYGANATQAQRVEALLSQLNPGGRDLYRSIPAGKIISPVRTARSAPQSVENLLDSLKKTDAGG